MEKAKLRKKEIDAMESFLRHNTKQELLEAHLEDDLGYGDWYPLKYVSFATLATALYVGYELKKEPEDLIREYYEKARATLIMSPSGSRAETEAAGERIGIRKTLEFLGITIEGVNE